MSGRTVVLPQGRQPSFEKLEDEQSQPQPQPPWYARAVPVWLVALLVALDLLALSWFALASSSSSPAVLPEGSHAGGRAAVADHEMTCTEAQAGAIRFNTVARRFQGCDGSAWSLLAFCCAPERPEPPRLLPPPAQAGANPECELWLSWHASVAHGSPVSAYSLSMRIEPAAGAAEGAIAPRVVYRGPELGSCVAGLGARLHGAWFSVTAHAVGGDSEPSEAVELQSAPTPVRLEAQDDGSCAFDAEDVLRVHFDRPTNRAGEAAALMSDAGLTTATTGGELSAEAVRSLLNFSSAVGAIVGSWVQPDVLELRLPAGSDPPDQDPFLQGIVATVRPEGGIVVAPPATSLPASGVSPPLHVPRCFLDGFESDRLRNVWSIETVDVSAASVVFDAQVVRSGSRSLRFEGGRAVNFDGLRAQLPTGSRPSSVSFWLRPLAAGNVGYFTLGGGSIETSVIFFHLRADGTAGLLSSTGGWRRGTYEERRWLHVQIDIEWPYRRADLSLDGELVAREVSFASAAAADHADEIHLFNFDPGTVWWDDIVIRL